MLLVGVALPVLFFAIDIRLFAVVNSQSHTGLDTLLLFSAFVLQIGVLGVLAARLIELPLLRWSIYAWCWLLVDIQSLTAAELSLRYGDPTLLLVKALFAAQASLIVMWGVLGTTRWTLRLPASLAAIPVLAMPLLEHRTPSEALFLPQLFVLTIICGLMRWRGFTLAMPSGPDAADLAPPTPETAPIGAGSLPQRNLKVAQFGIRHVLIWTTSLAFALGVLRLLGLLSIPGLSRLLSSQLLGYATLGTLIAIVLIVALWAGLGQGRFYLRWSALAISCLAAGAALIYFEYRRDLAWNRRLLWIQSYFEILNDYWYWLAWTCLAGGLLFATLLMFRTLGYRLLWTRKFSSRGDSV